MTDILCCAKCKQPLKVVCDAHGTEWVPDRQTTLPPLTKDRPLKLRNLKPAHAPRRTTTPAPRREGPSLADRILAVLAESAQPVAEIARQIGHDAKRTGIYCCILAKDGRLTRVDKGVYARPTP